MGFKSFTVRTRLLWLTLGLVVPLVFAGFFNLWSFWLASRMQIEASLQQQAQLAASGFEQQLLTHRKTLETISQRALQNSGASSEVDIYLDLIVSTRPDWLDLKILDKSANIVSQQKIKLLRPPTDTARRIVDAAQKDNTFVVSTIESSDEKLHILALAMPVGNGNFVVAEVDVSSANAVFDALTLRDDNIIVVFDSKFRLVYRSRTPSEQTTSESIESELFSAINERRDGVIEVVSPYDRIERVYGLAAVQTGNYLVAVGVPSSSLYEPAWRQFARQAFFGLLIASLAIIAAFVFSRKIVEPLHNLTGAAREFGAGDMSIRADIASGGTVRELGLTFNQMANKIAEREEQLKALDQLKSDFVSNVSHELRTPLTTIKTLTRVLKSDKITAIERSEYLQTIADECDRQIAFVQNLLDLSRIESGVYPISLVPVDISKLLGDIAEGQERVANSRNLRLCVDAVTDLPPALTDAAVVRQIITSLVGNAMKYTPAGGEITLTALQCSDQLNIEVSDNGCGIAQDDLSHIFEKFYRGHPLSVSDLTSGENDNGFTPTNETAGVGLGLFIVENLVLQIGGDITVQSPIDGQAKGTKVTISLPLAG